jgi:hypothetical protein
MKNAKPASPELIEFIQKRISHFNMGEIKWTANHDELKMTKDFMCGKVIVTNPHAAMHGVDVVFVINEDIFDMLDENYQEMVIDKLVAYISHDLEKGKTSKVAADIVEHESVMLHYGMDKLLSLRSEINRIYSNLDPDKDEATLD